MPFSRRQRRTLRTMAGLWRRPVRIVVAVAAEDRGAPELDALRDWAALTPAVSFEEAEASLDPGQPPDIQIVPNGAKSPLVLLRGWPRGYEFVSFVQATYLASELRLPPRRQSPRPDVTLYTAPTCPHSPIQLRHLLRSLAAIGTEGPLTVVDATQLSEPADPAVTEVPFTVLHYQDREEALSGVLTEEEITRSISTFLERT